MVTVLGGRTYTVNALYTTAGWLDSVWATGTAGSFMGRRYVWGSGTGTLSDLRLSGKGAAITYDIKLRAQSTTFTGAVVTTRDFVTTNEMARTEPNQSQLATLGRRLGFGFGRIRSQFATGGAADVGNFFGYDKLDRLKADTSSIVTRDDCIWNPGAGWDCPPPTVESVDLYSYDGAGNRLDLGGAYNTGDRITAFDGCSYSTDADGNVTSRTCGTQTLRFYWTAENRLKAMQVVGADSVDFYYDALGRLARTDANGFIHLYALWWGDELFAELDGAGVDRAEYSYYPGLDRPHAIAIPGDTVFFHHFDGVGNVIGLVSAESNTIVESYSYDRWGASVGGVALNRARFKGALWVGDAGVELYYMRNRWYEPQSGRFLSEDPIGLAGGINPYTYAGNDPVNGRDPIGLCRWEWSTETMTYMDGKGWAASVFDGKWVDCDDSGTPGGGMAEDFGPPQGREPGTLGPRGRGGASFRGSVRPVPPNPQPGPSCGGAALRLVGAGLWDLAGVALIGSGAGFAVRGGILFLAGRFALPAAVGNFAAAQSARALMVGGQTLVGAAGRSGAAGYTTWVATTPVTGWQSLVPGAGTVNAFQAWSACKAGG